MLTPNILRALHIKIVHNTCMPVYASDTVCNNSNILVTSSVYQNIFKKAHLMTITMYQLTKYARSQFFNNVESVQGVPQVY